MNNQQICRDAMALSSGTLATLTGMSTYAALDEVQASFVVFVAVSDRQYKNWLEAWTDFWSG